MAATVDLPGATVKRGRLQDTGRAGNVVASTLQRRASRKEPIMHQLARVLSGCALALVLSASSGEAQNPPPGPPPAAPPQPTPEQMQAQMGMMGPAMATMTENMYAGMLKALAKPESAEQLATFMKSYRDALVAKGFTRDEAMQILRGAGMPSMPTR
jgi:hypothetical protein